jgi:hypothetical protein
MEVAAFVLSLVAAIVSIVTLLIVLHPWMRK